MWELYVIVGLVVVVVVAMAVWSRLRRSASGWTALADRLGLAVVAAGDRGPARMAGRVRGIEVSIEIESPREPQIGGSADRPAIIEARVRDAISGGAIPDIFGGELEAIVDRARDRYPGARIDIEEDRVRLVSPASFESPRGWEQAVRDAVELAEALEGARIDADEPVASMDRTSATPSVVPPDRDETA